MASSDVDELLGFMPQDVQSWALGQMINNSGGGAQTPPQSSSRPSQIPGMVQIVTNSGAPFVVSQDHAEAFQGLLNDLEARGYKVDPQQSGGYADRNIRGTNTRSNHAFGRAVDVNWTENPRGSPGKIPADVARELAQKYGMVWGGDWDDPDPMHFEIPRNAQTRTADAQRPIQARSMIAAAGLQPPQQQGGSQMPNALDEYLTQGATPAPSQVAGPPPQSPQGGAAPAAQQAQAPIPQVQAPPQGGGGWSAYLSDPSTRAFLISTGLQLMTGGWGNGVQQLGQAFGQGATAATNTENARLEQENKIADRDSRESIARNANSSREGIAAARNETTLLRAAIASGARTSDEHKLWQSDVKTYLAQARNNVRNVGRADEEMMGEANEYARQQMERRRMSSGQYGDRPQQPAAAAPQRPTGVVSSRPPAAAPGPSLYVTRDEAIERIGQIPGWIQRMFGGGSNAPPTSSMGGAP